MSPKGECQCGYVHATNELQTENPHCGQQQHQSWTNVDFEFVTAEHICDDESIVTFVFDDSQKVEVVKQFLCHWSPVFNAMLSSNSGWKESTESVIKLRGKQAKMFEILVSFCYTGTIPDREYSTVELINLFCCANEYQITKLIENLKERLVVSFSFLTLHFTNCNGCSI